MPWKRRAIMAGWFLAAGLLPKSVAARVVAWRLVPDSRDMTIDRILKAMRRMAR
jgi:hypothetical protein